MRASRNAAALHDRIARVVALRHHRRFRSTAAPTTCINPPAARNTSEKVRGNGDDVAASRLDYKFMATEHQGVLAENAGAVRFFASAASRSSSFRRLLVPSW